MKLLHVISTMDPRSGGPCQSIRNFESSMVEYGNAVEVVCLDDPATSGPSGKGLTIHALGKGRGAWCYHPKLRPWLDENLPHYDAVILHGLWQYPGYAMAMAAQRLDAPPYVVYPHGMLDPWFQRAPGRRLKAIRNWIYWKLIERHVIHRAAMVLYTCAEEMRLARDTFRPYQPKCEINAGYGVASPPPYHASMAAAIAQKCPGLNGRPYYVFLSRIHRKKGLDMMIRAFASIYYAKSAAGNGSPVPCLIIAGPGGETEYGQELMQLAAQLLPPDAVLWPGMLNGEAKWGALYGAEAFVLTSHQENFGIAVVEALACETPVLISNQVNIWREIVDDKAGFVAPDTLAGAQQLFTQWQFSSPAVRAEMRRAAKNCFENHFEVAAAARTLTETMQYLAKQTGGSSFKPKLA